MFHVADNISFRIADLRKKALGLTQAALAVRAGVGKQQVSNWETGLQRPARSRLTSWADRERWPFEIFAEGGPLPSETVNMLSTYKIPEGVGDPLEVPHMNFLAEADRALRETLHQIHAPYHVRVATAYAWLAARESRAPIPVSEIASRLGKELETDVSKETILSVLQTRPDALDMVEALARVLHVDPGWLGFGAPGSNSNPS